MRWSRLAPSLTFIMQKLDATYYDVRYLDELSQYPTVLNKFDPRVMVIITFAFIVFVVSFDKYEISGLLPFSIYPIVLISLGNATYSDIFKRVILVAPFAFFIGIFNPFVDSIPAISLSGITVSFGWISFLSIMIKFVLTVSVSLSLVSLFGFTAICKSLDKLGMPHVFVVQLMFLYRYIFVLGEEAIRMNRARLLRSTNNKNMGFHTFTHLIGYLLLRTFNRAKRIYIAMVCRGFDGCVHIQNELKIKYYDVVVLICCICFFVFIRFFNISELFGTLIMGVK